MLGAAVPSQAIFLLMDLQEEFGLTRLFIAHDLSVVLHVSTRSAVMVLDCLVELGLALAPTTARGIPTARRCSRRCRCPIARPACAEARPPLLEVATGHFAACPYHAEM